MGQNVAVVVGVGAELGLGAALCRRFASESYHVLVGGRTREKIEQVAAAILANGGSAEAVLTDATNEADVIRLFDKAFNPGEQRNPADLIVFNAGNNRRVEFRELSAQQFEDFWRVGCFGGFLVGREAARRLVPLGRESRVANDQPEHGARIWPAWNSCRAFGHRRWHRWRTPQKSLAANVQRKGR